jgi:hypothetical protein
LRAASWTSSLLRESALMRGTTSPLPRNAGGTVTAVMRILCRWPSRFYSRGLSPWRQPRAGHAASRLPGALIVYRLSSAGIGAAVRALNPINAFASL